MNTLIKINYVNNSGATFHSPAHRLIRALTIALCLSWTPWDAWASEPLQIHITYIQREVERPPVLSNLDPWPEDEGEAGARLAIRDSNTTGRFLNHRYTLEVIRVRSGDAFAPTVLTALGDDAAASERWVITGAPAADLLALADAPQAARWLIFNTYEQADALRDAQCRGNVLHTIPSFAMRADALAQFSVKRKWTAWALITGPSARDQAFAQALRRSARTYRIDVEAEKGWQLHSDIRRNASQEVPLFTQSLPDHDLMVLVDEQEDYARYFPYNTWDHKPIAGGEGLRPVTWSRVMEQYGAAQLQKRFAKQAKRAMRPGDYAAWAAVRAISEAVTRTGNASVAEAREYLLGDAFELAGFKGRPLSFRPWNGQLRQPIALVHNRAVTALAPIEGFLHQYNPLDSLGLDRSESACGQFR